MQVFIHHLTMKCCCQDFYWHLREHCFDALKTDKS